MFFSLRIPASEQASSLGQSVLLVDEHSNQQFYFALGDILIASGWFAVRLGFLMTLQKFTKGVVRKDFLGGDQFVVKRVTVVATNSLLFKH